MTYIRLAILYPNRLRNKNTSFKKISKMEKEFNRHYIKIRCKLGVAPVNIHKELELALGDSAPSYRTVARWASEFNSGREDVKDDPRSGRPVTTVTPANIERIRQLIDEDPHITYDEIEAETLINKFSIHEIIHGALKLKKVTSRWVPHELTLKNRQDRVKICQENLAIYRDGPGRLCDILTGDETWIYLKQLSRKSSNASWVSEGEEPRTIARRDRFEPKIMFSIFFRTSGPVLVHAVEKGKTIDNQYYIENCLGSALNAVCEQRKSKGTHNIRLLHDNARPHVHSNVDNFLTENGIKVIQHPPYSPDLAPSDFWLNDYIKRHLEDYKDEKSLIKAVTRIVQEIPVQEYRKTFNKWIERLEFCVEAEGDYFEHFMK